MTAVTASASSPGEREGPGGTGGSPGSAAQKLPRLSLACNQCRKRKVRCDAQQPKCRNCILRGDPCETTDLRKPGSPFTRRHATRRREATDRRSGRGRGRQGPSGSSSASSRAADQSLPSGGGSGGAGSPPGPKPLEPRPGSDAAVVPSHQPQQHEFSWLARGYFRSGRWQPPRTRRAQEPLDPSTAGNNAQDSGQVVANTLPDSAGQSRPARTIPEDVVNTDGTSYRVKVRLVAAAPILSAPSFPAARHPAWPPMT